MLVLEETLVAAAAAAAVQRMRGLPEPVGLGTERQHMFMASFLPPLRSPPPLSLSRSPFANPRLLIFVLCYTCARPHEKEIKVFKSQALPSLFHLF